jgi:hypothetical protein
MDEQPESTNATWTVSRMDEVCREGSTDPRGSRADGGRIRCPRSQANLLVRACRVAPPTAGRVAGEIAEFPGWKFRLRTSP